MVRGLTTHQRSPIAHTSSCSRPMLNCIFSTSAPRSLACFWESVISFRDFSLNSSSCDLSTVSELCDSAVICSSCGGAGTAQELGTSLCTLPELTGLEVGEDPWGHGAGGTFLPHRGASPVEQPEGPQALSRHQPFAEATWERAGDNMALGHQGMLIPGDSVALWGLLGHLGRVGPKWLHRETRSMPKVLDPPPNPAGASQRS